MASAANGGHDVTTLVDENNLDALRADVGS
jgi:hypothetical protein